MTSTTVAPHFKNTSLYVGDLHPSISDGVLYQKFSDIGMVLNARVCRDLISRESLGYGYVNFRDPADAQKALEVLNYTLLSGRPLRLMWSQKDPSLRKSGKGNIFIKNLEKTITSLELYDTFEQFGTILSCKLAIDEQGHSKSFGFVHFESEESAEKAINYVNGRTIRSRIVYVCHFIPKSERKSTTTKFNNCYVKNFGEELDDEQFKSLFEKFGKITSSCIMKNSQGTSKGFGFVCFEDPSSAESAVKEMDNFELNGKPLYVTRAQRKQERVEELKAKFSKANAEKQSRYPTGVNIYVKNLDDSIDDEKLREAFSVFGNITSAKVMRDENGISRCFGFVCFRDPEQATVALNSYGQIKLGSKPLVVAIAQRKDDRRAKLTADYQARHEQLRSIYPIHPSMPFIPQGPGFPPNRAYYNRGYPNVTPRWQQNVMPNQMPTYQTGIGAQSNNPAMFNTMMRYHNNPATGSAALGSRVNMVNPQLSQMSQMARPNQNRISMPTQMIPNRNVAQMPQSAANFAAPVQNRGPQQTRMSMPAQSMHKEVSQQDLNAQKEMLGNRLYPMIEKKYSENVAKLTGMILSMEVEKVMELFDDEKKLNEAMENAHKMLKNATATAAAGMPTADGGKA